MLAAAQENISQRRGIALTVSLVLHGLLLLLFILYKIITPIPPFPEKGMGGGQGFELALGFSELGMGDNTDATTPSPPAAQQEVTPPPADDASVLTSEVDDSPTTEKPKDKDKPKPDQPKEKPKPTEEEIRREKQRKIDELMGNKGTGSDGKGSSTTPGTSGTPGGSPTGTGIGTGVGTYIGGGIGFELGGRNVRNKPVIKERPDVGGTIVMDIWVDREGKVIRATWNSGRSTTTNAELVSIAKAACLATTFSPDFKANTGVEQKGAMVFKFELE